MVYLFWAFVLVWLGVFVYLYGLVRRARALEREVSDLRAQSGAGHRAGSAQEAGGRDAAGRPSPASKSPGAGE